MTDQELIRLLQEKPPSEFTAEEFELLRARWTQSPELRQALIDHLKLESQLTEALGQIDLDIDSILRRAREERRRTGRTGPLWRWTVGLCLLLIGGFSILIWNSRRPAPAEIAEVAPHSPTEDSGGPAQPASSDDDPPADALEAIASRTAAEAPAVGPAELHPVPAAVADNEPWSETLARDSAPWPFRSPKLIAGFRAAGHDELPEAEFRRWFTAVNGQPFQTGQDAYGQQPQRRVARFHGFARLRAPWPDDALLRLTPFDITDMTIYLWRGPRGVALRFYTRRDPHLWAAFEVDRETSSPKPNRWGLLTTDNSAYVRAGTGTFDLRCQEGSVVLSRGGIPLLTTLLAGPPDEVFVEGQFRLRGISIHRSAPLPSVPENPHPVLVGGAANQLDWVASAETPAELVAASDGRATFKSDSRDRLGTVVLPLPRRGLYEVIARVDAADPGTGIFLGDRDGRPTHRVGFFKDAATSRMTVGVLRPGEVRDQAQFDFNAFPPPYHTSAQWIRILAGLGTVQVQVSGDGRHWGHLVENPARDLPGAVGSIGLYGLPGPAARSLTLAHLEVRSLSALEDLLDRDLESQVPQYVADDWKDHVRWAHTTLDAWPREADLPRWLTTCVAASLTQGPPREFSVPALRRLVQVAVRSPLPLERKLQLIDEAALLCDTWDEGHARALADNYMVLGSQLDGQADPPPLDVLVPAVVRSSLWSTSKLRFAWDRQASRDLIRAAYRGHWPEAWQASQAAHFWTTGPHPDFVPTEWAETLARQGRWVRAMAVENSPGLDDGSSGLIPPTWRHPLALQWNKEAYNVRAELQSALTGQSYEDACRIVMSINVTDGPGLLPDMDDRQLFVSLPTAVAGAMQVYPEFEKLMIEKFGPLGVIRVRQAIQSGDVRGAQAATLQFFGTEAAAEAHLWLGDRDLSAGRFPSAEEHFLLGVAQCLPRQRSALETRLQLAMALNGAPVSKTSPLPPLEIQGSRLETAELEALVKSLAQRPSLAQRFQAPPPSQPTALPSRMYRAEVRSLFDGQPGLNPGKYEFRFGDPFGRQLATANDGQRLYVTNRIQINAYTHAGQQAWAQSLGSEQGEAYAMPLTPMPPLLAGDRLFVRRAAKGGVELACLKADQGQVLWSQRPNLQVLSDPVFWNGSLCALTLSRFDDDHVQVEATRFDFETGAATSSQPLFRLREGADRSYAAQLAISGRLAVCSLAGVSCCFDGSGEIHWLRRHLWLPRAADDLADDFRIAAPVLKDDRVIVSVPGVRELCCMDLETGRQIWKSAHADLRGLLAVHQETVLVDTVRGILALDRTTGRELWHRSLESRLEALQIDDQTLVVAQRQVAGPQKTRPFLVWLSLATGRELAQSQVLGLDRQEFQFGPLMSVGGKWWSFAGQGWKETKRELVELIPVGPSIPGPVEETPLGDWLPELSLPQLADLSYVLPGWHPAANYGSRIAFLEGDQRGESQVIASKLDAFRPIRFLRVIDVPRDRKTTLRLRYGNLPDRKWQLSLRAGAQTLHEQLVEDAGSANGWRESVIDLTPWAGQKLPLELIQSLPAKEPQTDSLWKRASIVIE